MDGHAISTRPRAGASSTASSSTTTARRTPPRTPTRSRSRRAIGAIASLGIGGLVEAGVKGGIEATIGFDLNDIETEFLNDLPVGDGKLYGSELFKRIMHGPQCLFDMHGELKVFLEAFLWIGIDLGFSDDHAVRGARALRRRGDRRVRLGVHPRLAADIAFLTRAPTRWTLRYAGRQRESYVVDVLDVDDDLTLARLMKDGYLDTEFYTRAEENALRDKLALYRATAAGKKVIVVSTSVRAEVFLEDQVDHLIVTGTELSDRFSFKRLNGIVDTITINAGGSDDLIEHVRRRRQRRQADLADHQRRRRRRPRQRRQRDARLAGATRHLHHRRRRRRRRTSRSPACRPYSGVHADGRRGRRHHVRRRERATVIDGGAGFDVILGKGGADIIDGGDEKHAAVDATHNNSQLGNELAMYRTRAAACRSPSSTRPTASRFAEYDAKGVPADNAAC